MHNRTCWLLIARYSKKYESKIQFINLESGQPYLGMDTWMYDIKTHQPEMIREDLRYYSEQLNVYAFIWQNLRKNELDKTAVISTSFPRGLDEALKENNPARVAHEFAQ